MVDGNIKNCLKCSKPLTSRSSKKYCSVKCSSLSQKRYKKIVKYSCKFCDSTIESTKPRKYCNNKCQLDHRYKQYIDNWKTLTISDMEKLNSEISKYIRRYIFEKFNSKCCKCGWCEINKRTGKTPLQIDHIDGNAINNLESNLELLCPNCHALTETYGYTGKSSTRLKRMSRYYNNSRW